MTMLEKRKIGTIDNKKYNLKRAGIYPLQQSESMGKKFSTIKLNIELLKNQIRPQSLR